MRGPQAEMQGHEWLVPVPVWRQRATRRYRFDTMPEGWMQDNLGE